MNIRKVKIVDNNDLANEGTLTVVDSDTNDVFEAFYTSPYGANKHGGFISVPQRGQLCLVCSPEGKDSSWYYMSSIWGKDTIDNYTFDENTPYYSPEDKIMGNFEKTLPKRVSVYDDEGNVVSYFWETPAGNKIILKDGKLPSVTLMTQKGKFIQLNDSPEGDAIVIQNEWGDRISITNKNNNESGDRGISAVCEGNITLHSHKGTINLGVYEGKEVNIVNHSKDTPKGGNVNITSYNGDINAVSYAEEGNINLITKTEGSDINLKSGGNISLYAKANIEMKADEGIKITTVGGLEFEATTTEFNKILLSLIYAGINLAAAAIPSGLVDIPSLEAYESIALPETDYND